MLDRMRYEVMRLPIQSYLRALLSPLLFKQSSDCAPIQSYNGASFLGGGYRGNRGNKGALKVSQLLTTLYSLFEKFSVYCAKNF